MRLITGVTRHLISGVLYLGVISLICARASAQNLFAVDADSNQGIDGIIDEFTPDGVVSIFTSGLNTPTGLAFDKSGNLFVADGGSGAVYKFTPAGVRTTFASGLILPTALTVDGAGNLFVVDAGLIYKFTPTGARTSFATLQLSAIGLAFDSAGNLFVAAAGGNLLNSTGKIFKFTPTGARTTFASGLVYPFALAFDSAGNLFVADSGVGYDFIVGAAVYKFTPSGLRSTVASQNDQLPVFPNGLAIDSADNLFVTDGGSASILKFTSSGVRTTFAARFVGAMAFQPTLTTSTPTPTPTPTPGVIAPAIMVTVSPTLVHKGETAVFAITLSTVSANAVTVSYTVAGRARLGRHYTLSGSPGQATIPAGTNSADVVLTCLGAGRRPKTATVVLMPGATYDLSAVSRASVIISR